MKTVIECTNGYTEQTIGGTAYYFERDEHGRFVNDVGSVLHRSIFLNVQHYREVPLEPEQPTETELPAFLTGITPGEGTEGTEGTEGEAPASEVKPKKARANSKA